MGFFDFLRRLFAGGSGPPADEFKPHPCGQRPPPAPPDTAITVPPSALTPPTVPGHGGPRIEIPPHYQPRTNDGLLREFALPVAHTATDLAACMERTPRELYWLADPQRTVARGTGHYQPIVRRKRGGRVRIVLAPRQHLKAAQRWVLRNILDRVNPHGAAHGFRRGRSIRSHARGHVGRPVVVQCDLENWFHQHTYVKVRTLFQRLGYGPTVARLLALICTAPVQEMSTAIAAATGLTPDVVAGATQQSHRGTRHALLPQGAPTSPKLANLLSINLDRRLASLATSFDARYTRYADDCAFSGSGKLSHDTARFIRAMRAVMISERVAPSPGKLWIRRSGSQQLVTGLIVNEGPNVPRTQVRQLRAILHNCVQHGPASQNRTEHEQFAAHLLGRIAHVAAANPEQGAKLRRAFNQIRW